MINAKELRLGNWVLDSEGVERQVTVISAQGRVFLPPVKYVDRMPKIVKLGEDCSTDLIHPIPLTPEVLEACEGVKRTPNADWFDWVVCGLNINYNADDDVYFIYEYPNIVFNSLHQLQNLVALTGQELEYKPKV